MITHVARENSQLLIAFFLTVFYQRDQKRFYLSFWRKPLYTRVASREYTIPRLLVATQAYRPASEAWTLVIFTVPGLGMLIRGSDKSRGLDCFIHVITGDGLPVALH